MITTHNNNNLNYNKNNNIYNTNNSIFYQNYINTCEWAQLEVRLRRLLTHLGVGRATQVWRTCYFFL